MDARRRPYAVAAILLGIAVSVIDASVLNLALPGIARHFNASPSAAVWVVSAYQIAIVGLLLPCAQLGERFGYRRVYLLGLGLFTVASLACVMAGSLLQLAAARALQGVGAAGMMAVNAALVRLTYPPENLAKGIALNSMVVAASAFAGPTVAGLVLSAASWRWIFIIQLPIALAVWLCGRRSLPDNPRPTGTRAVSPLDIALNVLMFALVFLGLELLGSGARPEGAPSAAWPALALLVAGVGIGSVFLRRQWHQSAPLFPLDLLRIPVFALSICTSVSAFAAQTLSSIAMPFLLLESQGRTPLEAGMLLTAWPAAVVVSAPLAARLIVRVPSAVLSAIGLAVLATGYASLALLPQHPSLPDIAWRLVVCGVGFGLFQSPNNHIIYTTAPLARSGAASGALGTARLTGQAIGAVLLGAILGVAGIAAGPPVAMGLGAVLAATACLFSAARTRTRTR